jgi:hypothetical protein
LRSPLNSISLCGIERLFNVSYAHSYPMAPSGGLFVFVLGLGIVLGAFFTRARYILLGASGGIAVLTLPAFARSLTAPFGVPSAIQIWSMVLAVAFEAAAIFLAIRRLRARGERAVNLGILIAVALHFLVMTPALGPVVVVLGVLTALNAWGGLRSQRLSLQAHWLLDGSLKLVAGALLWFAPRLLGP